MNNEFIDIGHEGIINETDGAVLFKFEIDVFKWIPKSLIEDYDEEWINIPLWVAEDKEIEGYGI